MDPGEYESIDYGVPPPLPQPLKSIDILDSKNGPLVLPPLPQRYSNGPKKIDASPQIMPKPNSAKKPPPIGKKPHQSGSSQESHLPVFPHGTPIRHTSSPSHTRKSSGKDGETLMLSELVRKYSKMLPLRIRVNEGYCGSEEKYVISSGDIYNFHFVKNEKVVSIRDCGGHHFSIPLNSDIKFGLLYNLSSNFKEAVKGHVFKSVADIASAKITPRILRVLDTQLTSDAKPATVQKNELLIVKKVGKPVLRKAFIKVYSFTSKEEKMIQDDFEVSFSTDPQDVQLYLPEILDFFPDSFPMECMMFSAEDDIDDLPSHLTSDMVSLTHVGIQSAIIATTHWDDASNDDFDTDDDEHMPISIPIEMEIEVTILEDADEDDLYHCTLNFIKTFDLSKVKDMKDDKIGDERDDGGKEGKLGLQRSLNKRVRQGYEFRGVDITMSDKVYDIPIESTSILFRSVLNLPLPPTPFDTLASAPPPPPPSLAKPLPLVPSQHHAKKDSMGDKPIPPNRGRSLDSSTDESIYVNKVTLPLSHGIAVMANQPLPLPKTNTKNQTDGTTKDNISEIKSSISLLRNHVDVSQSNSQKEMKSVQDDIGKLALAVERLAEKVEGIEQDMKKQIELPQQHPHKKPPPPPPPQKSPKPRARSRTTIAEDDYVVPSLPVPSVSPVPPELRKTVDPAQQKRNIEDLKAMGVQEVLQLLDIMNLTQYKECFSDESIDGEILAECDDLILEKELQIMNRLHRSRIMKVITGRHSAGNLSDGLDPYGATFTRS